MARQEALRGVADRPRLSAVFTLLKPHTWFPPMWAYLCGVVASGASASSDWFAAALGVILAGPLVCATSQAVNDWFDRDVDAINEPSRPIPSGRIPGRWGLYIGIGWTVLSLLVAMALGLWVFLAAVVGLALAWAYSAPPFRLKRNGWYGNTAVALCYEGLPWFTAVAAMTAALPDSKSLIALALYSFGAHGIMTLNDFKSVRGDAWMGIRSIPVQLGIPMAARLACAMMLVPQLVLLALLVVWDRPGYAAALGVLVATQVAMMARLLRRPQENDYWYNATGVPVYVLGMMVVAFALRTLSGTGAV
jgi:chlorophyll/bacteriochlorophyll a synthase